MEFLGVQSVLLLLHSIERAFRRELSDEYSGLFRDGIRVASWFSLSGRVDPGEHYWIGGIGG